MPWRFWQALCSGTGRHLLGLLCYWLRQTVSPKSWVWGRKLRISNCSPESQKKEKVSPPGVRAVYQSIPFPPRIRCSHPLQLNLIQYPVQICNRNPVVGHRYILLFCSTHPRHNIFPVKHTRPALNDQPVF